MPAPDPFVGLPADALQLAARWSEAAWNPAIDSALTQLYKDIADSTNLRGPVCNSSGRCCKFEEYGHRLYVTGIEVAWCLRGAGVVPNAAAVRAAAARGDCPFLDQGRCGVHPWRPVGCRAYFCDPRAAGWQEDLSEHALARLRTLHDEHSVPYRYGEWRVMLAHFASEA